MTTLRTLAALTACAALTAGCATSPPVDSADLREAVRGTPHLAEATVRCDEPLPFSWACYGHLDFEPEVEVADIVAGMERAGGVADLSGLTFGVTDPAVRADFYGSPGAAEVEAAAELAVLAARNPQSEGMTVRSSRGLEVSWSLVEGSEDVAVLDAYDAAADLGDELSVRCGDGLSVSNGSEGAAIAAEVAVGRALAGRFVLRELGVSPGVVRVVVEGPDLAAAKALVAGLPQAGEVGTVDVSSADDFTSDEQTAALTQQYAEALRGRPGFLSVTGSRGIVTVAVDDITDARPLDEELGRLLGLRHDRDQVGWRDRGARVTVQPRNGRSADLRLAEQLVAQQVWGGVRINGSNDRTDLTLSTGVGPMAVGRFLADTALRDEPRTVEVFWGVDGDNGRATITTGSDRIRAVDPWGEPVDELEELQRGWELGRG